MLWRQKRLSQARTACARCNVGVPFLRGVQSSTNRRDERNKSRSALSSNLAEGVLSGRWGSRSSDKDRITHGLGLELAKGGNRKNFAGLIFGQY